MVKTIDINCDVGEGFASDERIIPLVSSINIACGFHAGDPRNIGKTVQRAVEHGVAVGAHPSWPDREGFGRRPMAEEFTPQEVRQLILYQVGAAAAIAKGAGAPLHHVKPHGALYNQAARDKGLALAIAAAVAAWDAKLFFYAPPRSALEEAGRELGLRVIREVFVDRGYRTDGSLVPRGEAGDILQRKAAVRQALGLVDKGTVQAVEGIEIPLAGETLCLHGDGPQAWSLAVILRKRLTAAGVVVAPPGGRHD